MVCFLALHHDVPTAVLDVSTGVAAGVTACLDKLAVLLFWSSDFFKAALSHSKSAGQHLFVCM